MTDEPRDPTPERPRSFVTDALQRIRTRAEEDKGSAWSLLTDTDRRRLLQLCYLWPLTCCGFFLPLIVFLRYRHQPDIGLHARHGMVFAAGYAALGLLFGLINGVLGRIVDDWVNVSLVCGGVLLLYLGALTVLGLGWYQKAVRGEDVEIPWVTGWVERF